MMRMMIQGQAKLGDNHERCDARDHCECDTKCVDGVMGLCLRGSGFDRDSGVVMVVVCQYAFRVHGADIHHDLDDADGDGGDDGHCGDFDDGSCGVDVIDDCGCLRWFSYRHPRVERQAACLSGEIGRQSRSGSVSGSTDNCILVRGTSSTSSVEFRSSGTMMTLRCR